MVLDAKDELDSISMLSQMNHSMNVQNWPGYWWLPDTPDDRVPGTLIVEPDGRCRLELIGGFDLSVRSPHSDGGETVHQFERDLPVVHGITRSKSATLLRCFSLDTHGGAFSAITFHRLHVHQALIGAHVTDSEMAFDGARIEIENLTSWLAFDDASESTDLSDGSYQATARDVDVSSVAVGNWTIKASGRAQPFTYKRTRARDALSSYSTAYLFLEPASPVAAQDFSTPILHLTDLITLATGQASGLIRATYFHKERTVHRRRDEPPFEIVVEVEAYGRRIHTAEPDAPAASHRDFRFTCRDRPFESLVTEWWRIRTAASAACNVYFGMAYAEPGFTETRLLLAAVAAEAFHSSLYGDATTMSAQDFRTRRDNVLAAVADDTDREWVKAALHNAPTLRQRLLALAAIPDKTAVVEVIGDAEEWARRVVRARNGLAHSADQSDQDVFRLEWATSGLLALVLMAELKLSVDVQQRASTTTLRPPVT